jgi:hypothetical protein
MAILDPPRCPNCNSEIALKELWEAAPKNRGGVAIIRPVGLACPTCGMKLRVLQSRLLWGLALAYVVPIAMVVPLFGHMPPLLTYEARRLVLAAVVVVLTFGAFRLLKHLIPRLLRVRILKPEEKVVFPLAKPAARAEETQAIDASDLKRTDDDRPEWTCKSCGEENPGNFDECWKCQTWRADEKRESDNPAATG